MLCNQQIVHNHGVRKNILAVAVSMVLSASVTAEIIEDVDGDYVNNTTVTDEYAADIYDITGSYINADDGVLNGKYSGVYIFGPVGEDVINKGVINTGGIGVTISGDVGGEVRNDGQINSSEAGIYYVVGDITGGIVNNGVIDSSVGIKLDGLFGATVPSIRNEQNGVITALDSGIVLSSGNSVTGNITNDGVIISEVADADLFAANNISTSVDEDYQLVQTVNGVDVYRHTEDEGTYLLVSSDGEDEGTGFYWEEKTTLVMTDVDDTELRAAGQLLNRGGTLDDLIENTESDKNVYTVTSYEEGSYKDGKKKPDFSETSEDARIEGHWIARYPEGGHAIELNADSVVEGSIINTGTLSANLRNGIYVDGTVETDIHNTSTGVISGANGIFIDENGQVQGRIVNDGEITGQDSGIRIAGSVNKVENSGTISGKKAGIYIGEQGLVNDEIVNLSEGTISGDIYSLKSDSSTVVSVDNSGLLDGNISGAFNLTNSGTIVTDQGSTLSGSYHQTEDGVLDMQLDNSSGLDTAFLTVDGEAVLDDGTSLKVSASADNFNAPEGSIDYLAIDASLLTYDEIQVLTNSNLIDVSLSESSDNEKLYIKVTAKSIGDESGDQGGSDNNVRTAYAIDTAPVSEDRDTVLDTVIKADEDNRLNELLTELAPDVSGALVDTNQEVLQQVFKNLISRLNIGAGVNSGDEVNVRGLWIQGLHSKAERDSFQVDGEKVSGFESRLSGLTFGFDKTLTDEIDAGVAISFAEGETKGKSSQDSIDTSSYQLSVYGSWINGDWSVSGIVNAGKGQHDSERYIDGFSSDEGAKADYDSAQLGAQLIVSHDFRFYNRDLLIKPKFGLSYALINSESYTETGASFSLSVDEQRYESLEVGAGVSADWILESQNGVWVPEVSLMAWHDVIGDKVKTSSQFVFGGNRVETVGESRSKETYQASLGLKYLSDSNLNISARYGLTAKPGYRSNDIVLTARYDF